MSWSEFAAGTIWAQLGYFGFESGGLNFAETRVRNVPGEGLEPSQGNPHRILSPQRANPNHLKPLYLSSSYLLPILAGVGWNGVVLCWRGYKMVTVTATSHQTSVFLAGSSIGITSPVCRLYGQVDWGHKDVSREGTNPEASPHLFLCGIPI